MLVYTKLVDSFSRVSLMHIITWFFVAFFAIFSFVLYPNAKVLHPSPESIQSLVEAVPVLKYLIRMIGGWSFSLFYIFSELWGSVMLSLLFWQLANQITSVPEAKRFYPLFGLIGQIGLFMAGVCGKLFSKLSTGWADNMQMISLSVFLAGALLSLAFWILTKDVGADKINNTQPSKSGKKPKVKMGFVASLKYILSSKYIGLITLLILCYGVSINLVEGVWKKSMELQFPDPRDYSDFMSNVQIGTAIMTGAAMIVGSYLLRVLSWKIAAILTPIVILLTGLPFFSFMSFQDSLGSLIAYSGLSALMLAVQFGAAQNILSKSTKYALFDPTKEMAYIPGDEDLKTKGKAAADVIGGRLGKSGGAVIQQIMLSLIPGATLVSIGGYLFVVFMIIMVVWFFAVVALSKEFTIKSAEKEAEDAKAAQEA